MGQLEYGQKVSKIGSAALILVELASVFSKGHVTGEGGVAVLHATANLLTENKRERKDGGMASALAALYVSTDLPVALIEKVVLLLIRDSHYRENMANACDRSVQVLEEYQVNLIQPWRDCLGELFEKMAQEKESGYALPKKLKSHALPDASGDEDDEEDTL